MSRLQDIFQVFSLDFDGCLFNSEYHNYVIQGNPRNQVLLSANVQLIDELCKLPKDSGIIFVGSNRQSFAIDAFASMRAHPGKNSSYYIGSCFSAIEHISKHTGVLLDKFLLSDLYGELPAGTSFDHSIAEMENLSSLYTKLAEANISLGEARQQIKSSSSMHIHKHQRFLRDQSKLTILYAQIHKVASEHPDKHIVFNFYDNEPEIIQSLEDFFANNPSFIPENVALRLNKYVGETDYSREIQGTGSIDLCYQQTIIDIANLMLTKQGVLKEGIKLHEYSGYANVLISEKIDAAKCLTEENVENIQQEIAKRTASSPPLFSPVTRSLIDAEKKRTGENVKDSQREILNRFPLREKISLEFFGTITPSLRDFFGVPKSDSNHKVADWIGYVLGGFIFNPLQKAVRLLLELPFFAAEKALVPKNVFVKIMATAFLSTPRTFIRALFDPKASWHAAPDNFLKWPARILTAVIATAGFAALFLIAPPFGVVKLASVAIPTLAPSFKVSLNSGNYIQTAMKAAPVTMKMFQAMIGGVVDLAKWFIARVSPKNEKMVSLSESFTVLDKTGEEVDELIINEVAGDRGPQLANIHANSAEPESSNSAAALPVIKVLANTDPLAESFQVVDSKDGVGDSFVVVENTAKQVNSEEVLPENPDSLTRSFYLAESNEGIGDSFAVVEHTTTWEDSIERASNEPVVPAKRMHFPDPSLRDSLGSSMRLFKPRPLATRFPVVSYDDQWLANRETGNTDSMVSTASTDSWLRRAVSFPELNRRFDALEEQRLTKEVEQSISSAMSPI